MKSVRLLFLILLTTFAFQCSSAPNRRSSHLKSVDRYTLIGEKNFLNGYEPINSDETINVVVEIPAGSNAKWEVTKPDGRLKWEFKNGRPRVVKYLPYPGNYGMVPRTLLPKELGGDGDPLDVITLGPTRRRGSVVKAKLIGVLKLLDGGEQDDKLLAVLNNSPFSNVDNLDELDKQFPGVTQIIELWFSNYKGPGQMKSQGFGDVREARKILHKAVEAFRLKP